MNKKITELVEELLGTFLEEKSLELYDVQYVKEGKDYFLRVFIDKALVEGKEYDEAEAEEDGTLAWNEKYVSTIDCEMVSEYLSQKLDALDPIEENYYLEVSSPGMDRELVKPRHFEKAIGEFVDVFLKDVCKFDEFKGDSIVCGKLLSATDDEIEIEVEVDTKAKNRKPGAKISKSALVIKQFKFKREEIKTVRLAVII